MADKFDPYHKWLGIPPHEQPPHHYRLLGVGLFESDPDVIEGAADRQMAHVQTHKTGPHAAISQKLLNELSAAKLCLLHLKKRQAYDEQLRQRMAATAVAVPVASAVLAEDDSPSTEDVSAESPAEEVENVIPGIGFSSPASAVSGRTRIIQKKQKERSQQTALAIAGLAVVLIGLLAVAGWKFFGGAGDATQTATNNGSSSEPGPAQRPPEPRKKEPGSKNTAQGENPEGAGGKKKSKPAPKNDPSQKPDKSQPKNNQPPTDVAVTPPKFDKPVDLLKILNPAVDVIAGTWEKRQGKLSSSKGRGEVLRIPVEPPADYRWTVAVEPSEKYDSLFIGLPIAGRSVMVVIDGWDRKASGLNLVDGREAQDNETTYRGGALLSPRRQSTVICEVRKRGLIQVAVDNRVVIEWEGDPTKLSHKHEWAPVPDPRQPFIGGHFGYVFSRLEMVTLPPEPKIVKKTEPKNTKPEKTSNDRGDLSTIGEGPKKKNPVPSEDDVQAERQQVRKTLKSEFAAARTPAEKGKLAERLFQAALDPSDKLPARYVLYCEARQLAAESGQIELLKNCIKELAKWFAVDALALKAESFPAAFKAAGAGADHRQLAETCLELIDDAITVDQFALADKFGDLAKSEAAKAKDADLKKTAAEKDAKVRRLLKDQDAVAAARKKLEEDADDGPANLVLGKHLCLARDEWDEGLPHLVKGSDDGLKKIAEKELNGPDASDEQALLGDAWWELAAAAPAADKELYKTRARHWYEQSLPNMTGAKKAAVELRLGVKSSTPATVAGSSPIDLLLKKAQTAIKTKKLYRSDSVGSNRQSKEFEDAVKEGGVLIGFKLRIRKNANVPFLSLLQPVFLTPSGEKSALTHGRADRNDTSVDIVAKEGYAVAAVAVRANPDRNNNNLTGFSVTFMRITPKGLSKKDAYDSEWYGDSNRSNVQILGESGKAIVGIYGTEREDNSYPTSLGLVFLP